MATETSVATLRTAMTVSLQLCLSTHSITEGPNAAIFSDRFYPPRRIAQSLYALCAHAVGEAEEEVAHGDAAVFDEAPRCQRAAAGTGEEHGQVGVRMAVAVGVAAAIDDHRVVQERLAVHVLGLLHLLQELREMFHVPQVDLGDLVDHILLVLVVREEVVSLGE